MHHPIEFQMIARIRQEELLRQVAGRHTAQGEQANTTWFSTHWFVIALSLAALGISLALLVGMAWGG